MNRAHYDSDGNIILEHSASRGEPVVPVPEDITVPVRTNAQKKEWSLMPEERKEKKEPLEEGTRGKVPQPLLGEGQKQVRETMKEFSEGMSQMTSEFFSFPKKVNGSLGALWKAAKRPIRLPGKRGTSHPQSALRLFVTDTVRFGGTFALIFGVLFSAVNYQSFFQIAKAQLALGEDFEKEEALNQIGSSIEKAENPFVRGNARTNILAYLPDVGPYENRLIIPKIGKNVPIVKPSMEALISENWKQFEEDIQSSLRDGVVHYPGSARPGQAGNFFVTGHSSYYPWDDGGFKDVFARLGELEVGDTYFVYYGGDKHVYRVAKKFEVRPTDVTVLDQPTDKRLATLMTCTPIGTTLRRLIVQAEEIDPVTGVTLNVGEKTTEREHHNFLKLDALPI